MSAFCRTCGTALTPDTVFCGRCGNGIPDSTETRESTASAISPPPRPYHQSFWTIEAPNPPSLHWGIVLVVCIVTFGIFVIIICFS
jgi:uncharacterized membrane protein YvbJ